MSGENLVVLDEPKEQPAEGVVPVAEAPAPEPEGEAPREERPEMSGREVRSRKRHQVLANENSWLRTRLESVQAELEARDQAVAEWKAESERNRTKYENSIEERIVDSEEEARQKLKQARIEGDVDAEVMYTDRLAELKADRARMDMIRIMPEQNSSSSEEQVFYPDVQNRSEASVPDDAQPLHEPLARFYDRNPWADPDSSEFDQVRAAKLSDRSDTLDKMLHDQGKQDLFGTDSYFRILENVSRGEEPPVPVVQEHRAPSAALGVDRPGASRADAWMQSHGKGTASVALNAQEMQIARNIGAAHGWSEKEAMDRYSENKVKFERRVSDRSLDERDLNVVPL